MSLDSPIDKARLGVITPLYVSPQQNLPAWIMLASVARRYPRVNTIAVVDVSRGPGLGPDPIYQHNIRMLKENNVTVLGYIESDEGAEVLKQDMKNWRNWYPEIDGFYFAHVTRSDAVLPFYEDLTQYAKGYLDAKFVAAEFSKEGRPALPRQFIISSHIDLFISYRDRNVPAPIDSLKGGIEDKFYAPHKFGIMITKLPTTVHSQRMTENVVRQAITHNIARYFYFHTDDGAREMHPEPFTKISEFLEVTVQDLDNIAAGEAVLPAPPAPANPTEFYVKNDQVISTSDGKGIMDEAQLKKRVGRDIKAGVDANEPENQHLLYDKQGVRKIYASAENDRYQEWYFSHDNDKNKFIESLKKNNILRRMQDGTKDTWLVAVPTKDDVLTLSITSPNGKGWLNTENTIFFKYLRDLKRDNADNASPYIIELGTRSGDDGTCADVGYEAAIIKSDGRTTLRKKVGIGLYTPTRATQPGVTAHSALGKWVGFKFVAYNHHENNEPAANVILETYILQNCTGSRGELVLPANQNWKLTGRFTDVGYWGLEDSKSEKQLESKKCKSVQREKEGKKRKARDILNSPGKYATLIVRGAEMVITNWSVREIKVEELD